MVEVLLDGAYERDSRDRDVSVYASGTIGAIMVPDALTYFGTPLSSPINTLTASKHLALLRGHEPEVRLFVCFTESPF